MMGLMRFPDSIQRFDALSRFSASIHWIDPWIRFIMVAIMMMKQPLRLCLMIRVTLVGTDVDVGDLAGHEDDYDDDGDADGSR
jgi:hypothetical protein